MSDIPVANDEYKMEAGSSGLLETCDESSMLIETVNDVVEKETTQDESYFVVTEVNGEQTNLIRITDADKIDDGTNSNDGNQLWVEICRICANASDHLIPIFKGEGLEHELNNKIHKYLPIQVSEEDDLPLHLCYHCAATLLAWHELVDGCLDAEQRLLQMQNEFQQKSQTNMLEESLEGENAASGTEDNCLTMKDHLSEEQHLIVKGECNEDSTANDTERFFNATRKKSFAAFCTTRKELISRNPSQRSNYNDTENEKTQIGVTPPREISEKTDNSIIQTRSDSDNNKYEFFKQRSDDTVPQRRNPIRSFRKLSTESIERPSENKKTLYSCENCERIFKREFHFDRHVIKCKKKHSDAELVEKNLSIEGEKFAEQIKDVKLNETEDGDCGLNNKARRKTKFKSYPCMHCNYSASKKKLLDAHCLEVHREVSRKKQIKQPRSIDKETIKRARVEIDGKIFYRCNDCGKDLYSPYTFSWHIRIHTGEKPYTCHLCGRQFRVNQGLVRHLRETHAGIKEFPCDICGRMFSTKRNVEDHRRIHTGERPFACKTCGKSFKQKASLFVHKRTHTDFFPFKCNYCNQGFRTRPPLMVHITKHTGEKPHACDICNRNFRIKYELKRHRLIHFEEKPWLCTDCGLSFRQKRYLVNHNKINHSANHNPISR